MNYIKKLQTEKVELENKLAHMKQSITDFQTHLHSEKFQGVQADGSRKDWISTADVLNWLREVKSETT